MKNIALVKMLALYILGLYRQCLNLPLILAVFIYYLLVLLYKRNFNWHYSLFVASLFLLALMLLQIISSSLAQKTEICSKKLSKYRTYIVFALVVEMLAFALLTWRYCADLKEQRALLKPYFANYKQLITLPVYTSSLMIEKSNSHQCYACTKSGLRLLLIFKNSSFSLRTSKLIKAGSLLEVKGSLCTPKLARGRGDFSERDYLASYGVYAKLKVKTWKTKAVQVSFRQFWQISISKLQNFHYYWHQLLSLYLPKADAGLVQALSLANGTYLSKQDKQAFQQAGIIHVLVASGQHINYLVILLMLIVEASSLNWHKRQLLSIVMLLILACFYLREVAFWRALCQFVVLHIARLRGHNLSKLQALSISNGILLSWKPYFITNLSFHLSLLACLTIYFCQSYFKQHSTYKSVHKKQTATIASQLIQKRILQNMLIMLCIQLVYGIFNLLDKSITLAQVLGNLFVLPQLLIMHLVLNLLSLLNALAVTFNLPKFACNVAVFIKFLLGYLRLILNLVNKCAVFSLDKRQLLLGLLCFLGIYCFVKIRQAAKLS